MDWIVEVFWTILLAIEGVFFQLVSYVYKLFTLMCQLNFNSLYALISPLIDRIQAVIIVLVVYKLGTGLIGMMINPESAPKAGTELIKNIFITVACLLLYNVAFSALNEMSMLILGAPEGYSFTVLNELANVTGADADEGLIMRFVFGEETDISEVGDFLAFEIMSITIRNTSDTQEVENALYDGDDGYNFMQLSKLAPKVGKTVSYFPILGIAISIYLIYVFFNLSSEVGIRVFKLLVLQMFAPLAIITIITKGWSGSKMPGYIKTYFGIYINIFFKVLLTLVVTVVITKFFLNFKDFFVGVNLGDEWYTTGLLLMIIVFAGYKFVLEAPALIKSIFGIDMGKSEAGFSSALGGMLAGGVAGAVGGFASGGSFGSKLAGGLAGSVAGIGQGAWNGAKGQGIVDAVKNTTSASNKRTADWKDRGGVGMVALGAANDVFGGTKRQDKKMGRYQEQMAAVEAYDKAQVEAIKDEHLADTDAILFNGSSRTAGDVYSSGYETVSFGESSDAYAQRMLEYDKDYQKAQATLTSTQQSSTASADDIAKAQQKVLEARNEANKRAKEYWNSRKSSASGGKVDEARKTANKKLGNNPNDAIDVSATKKDIANKQKEIQSKKSYQATHNQKKES